MPLEHLYGENPTNGHVKVDVCYLAIPLNIYNASMPEKLSSSTRGSQAMGRQLGSTILMKEFVLLGCKETKNEWAIGCGKSMDSSCLSSLLSLYKWSIVVHPWHLCLMVINWSWCVWHFNQVFLMVCFWKTLFSLYFSPT